MKKTGTTISYPVIAKFTTRNVTSGHKSAGSEIESTLPSVVDRPSTASIVLVLARAISHLAAMTGNESQTDGRRRRRVRKVTAVSLERSALYYLQRFSSSTANLRRILKARAERSAMAHDIDMEQAAGWIDDVIAKFTWLGLLDDQAYALARSRTLVRRGKPVRSVRATLAAKGVAPSIVENGLDALREEMANLDLAAAIAFARRRRFGPFAGPRTPEQEKQLAAFARAGFSFHLAQIVLSAQSEQELEAVAADQLNRPREA
ncbi:MAG: regulatory protein RecX [Sphingomonadales bacterium]